MMRFPLDCFNLHSIIRTPYLRKQFLVFACLAKQLSNVGGLELIVVGLVGYFNDIQTAGKPIFMTIEKTEFMKLLLVDLRDYLLVFLIVHLSDTKFLLKVSIHKHFFLPLSLKKGSDKVLYHRTFLVLLLLFIYFEFRMLDNSIEIFAYCFLRLASFEILSF